MKFCRYKINDTDEPIEGVFNGDTVSPIATSGVAIPVENVKFLPPVTPSKIVCVGRNYAEHAKELGNAVPTEPMLFLKAPSALGVDGDTIVIPPQSEQVEHEGELAVVIAKIAKNIRDVTLISGNDLAVFDQETHCKEYGPGLYFFQTSPTPWPNQRVLITFCWV